MSGIGIKARCLASTRVWQEFGERVEGGKSIVEDEIEEPEREDGEVSDIESSSDGSSMSSNRSCSVKNSSRRAVSCFQEAKLSPDGTCIFTTDSDRRFSVYPIDMNILEERGTRILRPYAQLQAADPIWAFAVNPFFSLADANSTTVLISRRDQYIGLHNALWDVSQSYQDQTGHVRKEGPVNISTKLASYKLVSHLTEAVLAPLSLVYSNSGAYFYAGIQNSIKIFDLNYTENPISAIATIPSTRNKLKGGGVGFKGHITSLSLSPPSVHSHEGVLAAGSRTRYVGLYNGRSGDETTHFGLPGMLLGKKVRNDAVRDVIGDGVTHMKWSPDGTYLYIAERKSDAILIYDARNFSLALGYCTGRAALTNQKLGFDIWRAEDVYGNGDAGYEIWAGGTDGKVRVWRNPSAKEGAVEADETLDLGDGEIEGPVVASLVHRSGSLAVVARGAFEIGDEGKDNGAKGKKRGGGAYPIHKERGSLNILSLESGSRHYEDTTG